MVATGYLAGSTAADPCVPSDDICGTAVSCPSQTVPRRDL